MEKINEECKKEKEKFFSILKRVIFTLTIILIFLLLIKHQRDNEQKIIDAFNDNKELICKSSIVSLSKGYKFEKNSEDLISNGVDIFNIKRCTLRYED